MRHAFFTFVPVLFAASLVAQSKPAAAKVDFEKEILPNLR